MDRVIRLFVVRSLNTIQGWFQPFRPNPILAVAAIVLWVWFSLPPTAAYARETSPPSPQSIQPYLDRVADQVTEFTLDNGMQFIVLERHQAPVVSFLIYADVGAVNEVDGKTGVAHYLEHLAFKGTSQIGTTNYPAEKALLDQIDQTFSQLLVAKDVGDDSQIKALQSKLDSLQAEAASYVEQNKYGQIIDQAGGVGLNATTAADATQYFYSLPSNKLELWMSLESERFMDPVFREFFEEKNVILEERRMRVDNSPIGTMVEKFLETAFQTHPYRRPVIGYETDLYQATRQDVKAFYDTYYGPGNLVAAVVGDVDPNQVQAFAEAYFGRYQANAKSSELVIHEPEQSAPREFTLELASEPWYLEGYHRPSLNHPDHLIYTIIESLLVQGRTSRLYKTLVDESQVALDIGSLNGFPGDKYENIFLLYGLTAPDHTVDEFSALMHQELERLQQQPVSPEELERVVTQAKASLLNSLDSNAGMASLLAEYQVKTGDWRNIFRDLKTLETITAEDVQRVAQTLFQPDHRTVGILLTSSS